MKRLWVNLAIAVALCSILGGVAKADSFTVTAADGTNIVQLTGFLTPGGTIAELQIQCLVSSICGSWYLGDLTLKGFSFTGTATSTPTMVPNGSGFTVQNGGQDNAAVGGGGGCNGTQLQTAVCWDTHNLPLTFQLGSGVNTFTASITNGAWTPGSLHVQVTAYDNTAGSQQGGGKVFAISDNLLVVRTPEPSSLGLLTAGLIGLAFFYRRRLCFNS